MSTPNTAETYAALDERRTTLEDAITRAISLPMTDDLGQALRAERLAHLHRLLVGVLAEIEAVAWGDTTLPVGYASVMRWARQGVEHAAREWDANALGWRASIFENADATARAIVRLAESAGA